MRCDCCNKELTPADIPSYTDAEHLEALKPELYFRCAICRLELPELQEIEVTEALKLIEGLVNKGATVWVKFTCHACNSRQTIDQENSFFTEGITCEECHRISVPTKIGWVMVKEVA